MATTGSALFSRIWSLTGWAREQAILDAAGSRPSWFPGWVPVSVATGGELGHVLTYFAARDGFVIGTDADFRRVPLSFRAARELAQREGWTFPTARMVDQIHRAAKVRVAMPTYGPPREATETYQRAHDAIEAALAKAGARSGAELTSGQKKDLVLSSRLPAGTKQIYGGRQYATIDSPIWQGLSYPPAHDDLYVDYSEQWRPIRRDALLDGKTIDLHAVLADPSLAPLVSGETPTTIDASAILIGIGSTPTPGRPTSSPGAAPMVLESSAPTRATRIARGIAATLAIGGLAGLAIILSDT